MSDDSRPEIDLHLSQVAMVVDSVEAVEAAMKLAARQTVQIDKRASRRLKKVNADGKVTGEVESAAVLKALVDREGLQTDYLKAKEYAEAQTLLWAIRERREAGLPDLCHGCLKPLSMTRKAVEWRDANARRGQAPSCRGCNLRRIGIRRLKPFMQASCVGCGRKLASSKHADVQTATKTPHDFPTPWATTPDEARPRAAICAKVARRLRDADIDPRTIVKLLAAKPAPARVERLLAEIEPGIVAVQAKQKGALKNLMARLEKAKP